MRKQNIANSADKTLGKASKPKHDKPKASSITVIKLLVSRNLSHISIIQLEENKTIFYRGNEALIYYYFNFKYKMSCVKSQT